MKTTFTLMILALLSLTGCGGVVTAEEEAASAEQSLRAGGGGAVTKGGGEVKPADDCDAAKATGGSLITLGGAMLQNPPNVETVNLANAYIETGKAMINSACGAGTAL